MSLATDVDSLFVPAILDLNEDYGRAPEQPSVKTEAQAALSTLDPELALQTPAVMDDTMLSLGKLSVEDELNSHLSSGVVPGLDIVGDLRSRWAAPGADESVVGATKAVAGPEEDVSHVTAKGVRTDRLASKKAVVQDYMNSVGYESVAGKALGVVESFARGANPVPTFEGDRLAYVLTKEFPDLGTTAYQNLGVAIQEVRDRLASDDMSVDQARVHIASLSAGIKDIASRGYYSAAQEHALQLQVLQPLLEVGEDAFLSKGASVALDSIGQNIDRVPFFNVLKAGKGAVAAAKTVSSVGLVKGTSAWVVAQTKAGVEGLVSLVTGRASNSTVASVQGAARTEDIIDAVALPKVDGHALDKVPYVQSALVPSVTRDQLLADPSYVFGAAAVKRINGAVSAEEVDGGIKMTAMLGTKNGAGYKSAQMADRANKRDFGGAGTVVQDGNGWYVQTSRQREYGLEEAASGAGDLTMPGTGVAANLRSFFGKGLHATAEATTTSNVAVRAGDKVAAGLAKVVEPYMTLPAGSQRRVAAALDAGDEKEVVHTIGDLRATYGLNDKEILGYASVRRAADLHLHYQNVRNWHKYSALGWRGLSVAGRNVGVKTTTVGEAVFSMKGQSPASIKALDSVTGATVSLDSVAKGQTVVRLMTPGRNGERFAIIPSTDVRKIGELPSNMTPKKAGYLPRPYVYPHYVKRFVNGVAESTVRPARSQLEGEGLVAELRAANPTEDFRVVQAQELRTVDDTSELEALEEAGLLWSSVRGASRQFDASGGVRMATVEDRIRSMVADGAMNAGLAKWGDAQRISWNRRFGGLFDKPYTPGMPTGQLVATGAADAQLVARAKQEAAFINNTLGVGADGTGRLVKAVGSAIGEAMYNMATRIDKLARRVRGDDKGSGLANDLRDIGDNLTGQSGRILANAKTVPYLLYIAGNPIRQLPLQMTLIPSYFGVQGAATYGLKGGFSRDFSILMASGLTEQGAKLAGKLGSDASLVADFRASGLMDSLEHHTSLATIGTTGATSSATRWGNGVDASVKMLTNVGVGAGIKAEKVSAWLISRNRWKTRNPGKAMDARAQQEISSFAEELSLNPNRSDQLPIQHGILGFFTQFMAMQVKQVGRTFQAIPGVGTGGLSKAEAQRMVGINLLTYGIGGYGFTQLADKVLNHPDMQDLPEDARAILSDGLANYGLDKMLGFASNEEADTAFSESFSPNSQLGGSVALVPNLANLLLTGDYDTLANARWQAPALGLAGNVAEAVKFAAAVIGAPALPTPESDHIKLATIAKKTMAVVPALNNWMKTQAALEYRAKMDSRGDPLVEASYGEALVAIAGVKTKEEARMWELNNLLPATSHSTDEDLANVRDAAYETGKWLLPLLDNWVDGKVSYAQASAYIDTTNAFFFTTLPPVYHAEFVRTLRDAVDKRWSTRYDSLIQRVIDEAGSGKLPVTEDAINAIATRIPDTEKRKLVTDRMHSLLFGAK